jgi:tRNA(Ile)-lysidine synthase
VAVLAELPEAVRSRVLRRAAVDAGAPGTDLNARHVAELDRLVTDWHGQGPLHLPGRVRAARDRGMLHLSADDQPG